MKLVCPYDILFRKTGQNGIAAVSVLMSCYKYGKEAGEALASVLAQTEPILDLMIVDDCSPDNSAELIEGWLANFGTDPRFANISFVRHRTNQGLSCARNTALALANTPYVFILDADNILFPRAIAVLREAVECSGYAMAFSLIAQFGGSVDIMGNSLWNPDQFRYGNYIDAMALIRTDILRRLGGYRSMPNRFGWEDYDLWCSFVDNGLVGCHVPQILCQYRVHRRSMIRTTTNRFVADNLGIVREDLKAHHGLKFAF